MCSMIVKNIEVDGMAYEVVEVVKVVMDFQTCKEFGFDSQEDKVVPKVDEVSLVNGVSDDALGGDRDEDVAIGEGGDLMMRLE
ncbi:hypothetical protein Tco_0511909 [Tanacetum coccineum]